MEATDAGAELTLEGVREEFRKEIAEVRAELREARGALHARRNRRRRPRQSVAEGLAWLERARELREAILRDRGGELLPPSWQEIRASHEERDAQILGE